MSKLNITPGPWEAKQATYDVEGDFKNWICSPSYGAVGYWTGHKQRHEDARWILTDEDAHLIAAAPELYEALDNIIAWFWSEHGSSERLQEGIKALAKARGES